MANNCSLCNSTGSVFNCKCFGDTQYTAGANVIARLYSLEGAGQLDGTSTNSIMANVISYGYLTAASTCRQSFVNQESQSINCNNELIGNNVLNNPNCQACISMAQQVYDSRLALEASAHQSNPNYTPQVLDVDIYTNYFGLSPQHYDGICQFVCEQCVTLNVSQNIQMHVTSECSVDTDEFISAFVNGMSIASENQLTQRKQGLLNSGLKIQSDENLHSLSVQMALTIRQMTSIEQLNSLNQFALNIQSMTITPDSTSVVIQNADQAISMSMFASLISEVYSDTNIQNSINYQFQQQVIQLETNFTDLVNSLSDTVSTIQQLLLNTVGNIMIILLVILFIIALVFAALFFWKPDLLFGGVVGFVSSNGNSNATPT